MKSCDFVAEQYHRINAGDTLRKGEKSCASLYATNHAIYSYGLHYPLLFQIETPTGRKLWVCNDGGYSVTTSKHISYARRFADVCAPIGSTSGFFSRTVDYETVKNALENHCDSLRETMLSKKRKDTQVYRTLQSDYADAHNALNLLTS